MSDPRTDTQLPAQITPAERLLTAAEFQRLAEVPPEIDKRDRAILSTLLYHALRREELCKTLQRAEIRP
jgi:hypothetical protein